MYFDCKYTVIIRNEYGIEIIPRKFPYNIFRGGAHSGKKNFLRGFPENFKN